MCKVSGLRGFLLPWNRNHKWGGSARMLNSVLQKRDGAGQKAGKKQPLVYTEFSDTI